MSLNILDFKPALEDLENGVAAKEKEYVWYGRLTDRSVLEKAISTEVQSQASLKINDCTLRVRKIIGNGSMRFVMTGKRWIGRGECSECSHASSQDMYDIFCAMAGQTMDKIRFKFQGPGDTVFELDMFTNPDGSFKEWCKVDWEVPMAVTEFPALPFVLEDVIFGGNDDYTAEQRKSVDKLLNKEFINPVATGVSKS